MLSRFLGLLPVNCGSHHLESQLVPEHLLEDHVANGLIVDHENFDVVPLVRSLVARGEE